MATDVRRETAGGSRSSPVNAAIAGVTAGLVFGLMIQFVLGRMTTIGALYTLGEPSLSIGWIAHVVHSAVFAVVYVQVTRAEPLRAYADVPTTGVATGAVFGFALWFVNIGFLWPVWLNLVTPAGDLAMPYHAQAIRPLVGHLVWGGMLGVLFPLLDGIGR